MRKIILFGLLVFICFGLSGCYVDSNKKDMDLIDLKVYDETD